MGAFPEDDGLNPLSDSESRLVAAVRAGVILELRPEETIRASVIRALVCTTVEGWPVAAEGVRLVGGRITGSLALASRTLERPLWIDDAKIPDGVNLTASRTSLLSFEKSCIEGGVKAAGAQINGSFFLNGANIKGICSIAGATITGQFLANSAVFENKDGNAITAQSSVVGGIFLNYATLKGVCDINSATIIGQFSANNAIFDNPKGIAINAQAISAVATFLHNAQVRGCCQINGAKISAQFSAIGANFENTEDDAINAQGSVVEDIFLDRAIITGACDINGATITGQFSASGAVFKNPSGDAICADFARIGAWFMRSDLFNESNYGQSTHFHGALSLTRAKIDQQFEIRGGNFAHSPTAIYAYGIETSGPFIIGGGARIEGGINLAAATIRGRLDLTGSHVVAAAQAGDVEGLPTLVDDPAAFMALDLSESRIDHCVMPATAETRLRGIVDLSRARVGTLTDYMVAWPKAANRKTRSCVERFRDSAGRDADHLVLDGFEYEHLDNPDGLPPSERASPRRLAKIRRDWLHAQSCEDVFGRLRPQPWRHLAKVLTAQGYEEEARRIAIERRVAQRHASGTGRLARRLSWLLHILADYGFNPWKALAWSGGVIAACAVVYGIAAGYCTSLTPVCADETVFVRTTAADFVPAMSDLKEAQAKLATTYPAFDPVAYSLDVFLPFVDLGTERFWRVNTATGWGLALYYFTIIEQIVGALLVSLVVTGFTGLLTRNEA